MASSQKTKGGVLIEYVEGGEEGGTEELVTSTSASAANQINEDNIKLSDLPENYFDDLLSLDFTDAVGRGNAIEKATKEIKLEKDFDVEPRRGATRRKRKMVLIPVSNTAARPTAKKLRKNAVAESVRGHGCEKTQEEPSDPRIRKPAFATSIASGCLEEIPLLPETTNVNMPDKRLSVPPAKARRTFPKVKTLAKPPPQIKTPVPPCHQAPPSQQPKRIFNSVNKPKKIEVPAPHHTYPPVIPIPIRALQQRQRLHSPAEGPLPASDPVAPTRSRAVSVQEAIRLLTMLRGAPETVSSPENSTIIDRSEETPTSTTAKECEVKAPGLPSLNSLKQQTLEPSKSALPQRTLKPTSPPLPIKSDVQEQPSSTTKPSLVSMATSTESMQQADKEVETTPENKSDKEVETTPLKRHDKQVETTRVKKFDKSVGTPVARKADKEVEARPNHCAVGVQCSFVECAHCESNLQLLDKAFKLAERQPSRVKVHMLTILGFVRDAGRKGPSLTKYQHTKILSPSKEKAAAEDKLMVAKVVPKTQIVKPATKPIQVTVPPPQTTTDERSEAKAQVESLIKTQTVLMIEAVKNKILEIRSKSKNQIPSPVTKIPKPPVVCDKPSPNKLIKKTEPATENKYSAKSAPAVTTKPPYASIKNPVNIPILTKKAAKFKEPAKRGNILMTSPRGRGPRLRGRGSRTPWPGYARGHCYNYTQMEPPGNFPDRSNGMIGNFNSNDWNGNYQEQNNYECNDGDFQGPPECFEAQSQWCSPDQEEIQQAGPPRGGRGQFRGRGRGFSAPGPQGRGRAPRNRGRGQPFGQEGPFQNIEWENDFF